MCIVRGGVGGAGEGEWLVFEQMGESGYRVLEMAMHDVMVAMVCLKFVGCAYHDRCRIPSVRSTIWEKSIRT